MHLKEGGTCKFSMDSQWKVNGDTASFNENHKSYSKILEHGCGLCAIFDFLEIGVDSIKITGRELDCKYILEICKNINDMINIAKKSSTKAEYISSISKKELVNKIKCDDGFDCFYPELGKWKR